MGNGLPPLPARPPHLSPPLFPRPDDPPPFPPPVAEQTPPRIPTPTPPQALREVAGASHDPHAADDRGGWGRVSHGGGGGRGKPARIFSRSSAGRPTRDVGPGAVEMFARSERRGAFMSTPASRPWPSMLDPTSDIVADRCAMLAMHLLNRPPVSAPAPAPPQPWVPLRTHAPASDFRGRTISARYPNSYPHLPPSFLAGSLTRQLTTAVLAQSRPRVQQG